MKISMSFCVSKWCFFENTGNTNIEKSGKKFRKVFWELRMDEVNKNTNEAIEYEEKIGLCDDDEWLENLQWRCESECVKHSMSELEVGFDVHFVHVWILWMLNAQCTIGNSLFNLLNRKATIEYKKNSFAFEVEKIERINKNILEKWGLTWCRDGRRTIEMVDGRKK